MDTVARAQFARGGEAETPTRYSHPLGVLRAGVRLGSRHLSGLSEDRARPARCARPDGQMPFLQVSLPGADARARGTNRAGPAPQELLRPTQDRVPGNPHAPVGISR